MEWAVEQQRKKEEQEIEEEIERLLADEQAGIPRPKKRFKLDKQLWFKLAIKAKALARMARREKNKESRVAGIIAYIKRQVEKRKAQEEHNARVAGHQKRTAAEEVRMATSESAKRQALKRQRNAEEEEARALAEIEKLEAQLEEAQRRMDAEEQEEDEFEEKIFDEKQKRAILRAEIAKSEKRRLRRRQAEEENQTHLRRASCEYNTDTFRRRTKSMEETNRLNEKLSKDLEERRKGMSSSSTRESSDVEWANGDEDEEVDEIEKLNREKQNAKMRKQQARANQNQDLRAKLDAKKAKIAKRTEGDDQDEKEMLKELTERKKIVKEKKEKIMANRPVICADPGEVADAMRLLKTADSIEKMAYIPQMYRMTSNVFFVNVEEKREEYRKLGLAKKTSSEPVKPELLSPRRRNPDDPPSPVKENLQTLRTQAGYPAKKMDRTLSVGGLERINSEFSESDRLREEARTNMSSFDDTMESARQLTGGARRAVSTSDVSREGADTDMLPSHMNRWYSQSTFMPPTHLHGENEQITSLQYNVAQAKTNIHKLQSSFRL